MDARDKQGEGKRRTTEREIRVARVRIAKNTLAGLHTDAREHGARRAMQPGLNYVPRNAFSRESHCERSV